jgi:5'-3' exonuclease
MPGAETTEPRPLLAIDGPFVMYRSFFALPDSITDAEDHPVNALLGAVNLVLRIAAEVTPRAIVVCWGAEAATYRTELYPDYHAARPPVPDALQWQFDRVPELMQAFGWTNMSSDTLEADDLLGSLALAETATSTETKNETRGRALVMTGDRDMYQCATDRVSVVFLKQGSAGFDTVDPDEVRFRYGIGPELVPDFIALRGDPSDGLPGAPGIGAKTAAQLLERHGSLEAAIAGADQERPRIAQSLTDNAQQLRDYREIATLRRTEVELPPDGETDLRSGAQAARGYGMVRLAERLERADTLADL